MATPILMPRQGQSVESCILVEWKVKPGDAVKSGDLVASIETDKAVFDVESPADGEVLELFFAEGADVPVLTPIAAIGRAGEDVADLRPAGEAAPPTDGDDDGEPKTVSAAGDRPDPSPAEIPEPATAESPASATASGRASPRARKRAEAEGMDAATLSGSGPAGRVIERDVIAAAIERGRLSPVAKAAASAGQLVAPCGTGPGGLILSADLRAAAASAQPKTIPVKGIRKIIATRMRDSLQSTAQLTLHRSFDATAIQQFRAKVKAHGETFGLPSVTLNDLIVFATVRTLLRHPECNAHFLGDTIVQQPQVNVGIAVDTPRGLMVPVVHGAEQMNLPTLARTIRPLAQACIEGGVQPDQLKGGTFTVTNLGALGIEQFTPVLNTPEVAILGVGGLFLKPVNTPTGVRHVEAMTLSLTIDHQAVDGAPGARFLQDLARALENIELLVSEGVPA